MKNSGRSKTQGNPNGERRKKGGKEMAPRSSRPQRTFLAECTEKELKHARIEK